MNFIRSLIVPALLSVSTFPALAGKSDDMDYGRFLSATFLNAEGKSTLDGKGCAANKGVAVKLGADAHAAMLFDTECVRMAGGWTGGWIKLKGVVFDGGHGPNPSPVEKADVFFQTNPGPVWSKAGDFADPRKLPSCPGAAKVPFGPIPREWAKYRGLHLHGDHVVFEYSVGNAVLLEMPDIEKVGNAEVLTRTFRVLHEGAPSSLIVAEGEGAGVQDGVGTAAGTAVTVKNAPAGAQLVADGARLILKLPAFAAGQTFKIAYAKAANAAAVKGVAAAVNLADLTKGGPAHWAQTLKAKSELAKDQKQSYVLDTIGVPFENPWKSWMRIGGVDFFADGRAAVSTWSGDVWIVSGIDAKLENVTWKRYATGLFHALGLKIVNGEVLVLGRDQITRLHDQNNDGEADWYECFNNDVQVTPGFHEFAFDLQTDPEGNFYFAKGGPVNPGGSGWGPLSDHNGCVFKISKDGQKFEVFATGLRAPNGMGVGPHGEVTVGDNQGTWVPVDYIHFAKQGEFIEVPDLSHRTPVPTAYSPHLCWIPYTWDNSCGGHVWVTSDKWGPFSNRMLYLSYGKCSLFGVLQERVGDVPQGGLFKFPFKFDSGAMRPRFNPIDGQLYVAGLKGWQTDGAKDSCFQRVRYTGEPVCMPEELHVTDRGITIGFTSPLDTASAGDVQNYSVEQWNYRWTKDYGSGDYKVSEPQEKGHDPIEIKSVSVSTDEKHVTLVIDGLKPVMQMKITLNIKSASGAPVPKEIANTINVVPPDQSPGKTYISAQ